MLYGCAGVGHAKPACDMDFDWSEARRMQTDISCLAERKLLKLIVTLFELFREIYSSTMFGGIKLLKPVFLDRVFAKARLNNLGDTATIAKKASRYA